jgi:glucose/arabinose dehydrogenase
MNNTRLSIISGFLFYFLLFFCFQVQAQNTYKESYRVDTIKMPEGLNSQTGGIDFLPDGRLVACFMRGEVMTYDLQTKEWKMFARGLQLPLGILAVSNSEVLAMQLSELTRIKDTDGDGHADVYENAANGFGMTGNYHEFNYGPVRDKEGNIYFALNTASSANGIRSIVRGKFNKMGRDGIDGHHEMFSVVPYRGWVMELNPDGKLHAFALGFRSPNGMGYSPDGHLFVTDNQSDWVPTGALYDVHKDHFYGHPASLVWKKGWENTDPFNVPIEELEKMRTHPIVQFPQGIMANSPSQPLTDVTKGKFGPFTGQLFIGEMNRDRILRVMLEEVGGELQGACIPFIDGHGLRVGNNRLAFAPDGNLWVGQVGFGGWVGESGIQKISFTGQTPMEVYTMNLTAKGFDLAFTQPVDAASATNLANYKMRHYRYEYKKKDINEGVDVATQVDVQDVSVMNIQLSNDGKKVSLTLDILKPGLIYELKLGDIKTPAGKPLGNSLICYTLNKLRG